MSKFGALTGMFKGAAKSQMGRHIGGPCRGCGDDGDHE